MLPLLTRLLPTWRRLLPPQSVVVVGTSGGPDSQVLLDLLAQARDALQLRDVLAVGIDHGLRPEANAELDLAAALAARHGIPFTRQRIQVPQRGNLLARARLARYAALRQILQAQHATHLAVAHTASDQVETILMNLCRGATLRGASGIRARRGALVRPLLNISRADVLAYAHSRGLAYATDPSNADVRRTRPRLRAALPTLLHSVNPNYAAHVAQFAQRAQEDERLLQQLARRHLPRVATAECLNLVQLRQLPPAMGRRVLHAWLMQQQRRVAPQIEADLWAARHSASCRGSWPLGSRTLLLDRGCVWCFNAPTHTAQDVAIPGKTPIPGFPAYLIAKSLRKIPMQAGHFVQPDAERVAFDADRLHFGLKLRSWQPGDRIRPFGLDGSTKVGDVFTNAKIPRALRTKWPLIIHGEEVLWVVGLRRGRIAPVDEQTQHVITLKLDGALLRSAC